MSNAKIKPARRPTHPSMDKFRALVKAKGWSDAELRDLLAFGIMAGDPPSLGAVRKWRANLSDPRLSRLIAIEVFIDTYAPDKGRPPVTYSQKERIK